MKRDGKAAEEQEQQFAERVAAAWAAGKTATPILEEASRQGVNVARVKTAARRIEPPWKPVGRPADEGEAEMSEGDRAPSSTEDAPPPASEASDAREPEVAPVEKKPPSGKKGSAGRKA